MPSSIEFEQVRRSPRRGDGGYEGHPQIGGVAAQVLREALSTSSRRSVAVTFSTSTATMIALEVVLLG